MERGRRERGQGRKGGGGGGRDGGGGRAGEGGLFPPHTHRFSLRRMNCAVGAILEPCSSCSPSSSHARHLMLEARGAPPFSPVDARRGRTRFSPGHARCAPPTKPIRPPPAAARSPRVPPRPCRAGRLRGAPRRTGVPASPRARAARAAGVGGVEKVWVGGWVGAGGRAGGCVGAWVRGRMWGGGDSLPPHETQFQWTRMARLVAMAMAQHIMSALTRMPNVGWHTRKRLPPPPASSAPPPAPRPESVGVGRSMAAWSWA